MLNSADVAAVRHVVQRILVPCVFVIGLLGNSVSIYVLTRKRMRCTTNIYLTALAITDIIYLTMALLLSLKHYDFVQRHVEIFWKCYGYVVWLCDACAYISIYIAVCFTIERFIAIRYPLKRQTFCTESLAKKVITGVALFCLFSTISTAFEHQYRITKKTIDIHGRACNLTQANAATERLPMLQVNYNEMEQQLEGGGGEGGRVEEELYEQQQQHRKAQQQLRQQQGNEQYLPLQHYMPLPIHITTTMPPLASPSHIDFEGSGGQVDVDERTERHHQQPHPHWQHTREIEAVMNKKDNLDSSSRSNRRNEGEAVSEGREDSDKGKEEEGSQNDGGGWQLLKPDVILRRLKHAAVDLNQTTEQTSTIHSHPTPLPNTKLKTATTMREWSPMEVEVDAAAKAKGMVSESAARLKGTQAKDLKTLPLAAATDQKLPSMIANYFALNEHSDLLFDAELLVSAVPPHLGNEVENEDQSTDKEDEGESERDQLLADTLRAEEWQTHSQIKQTTQENETNFFNITDYCEEVTYYQNSVSSLGENALYMRLWYFFTLFIFVLIPLCLLATFNCFLIMLVRRSKNLRGEMTNANSIRRSRMSGKGSRKVHSSSVSQENRITVTLIAVVLLFIVCQLPWAIYLIVSENVDVDKNVQAIIGNICNFLAAINAAANFFLYCVLSDKYRKTVRELITGYKYRGHARNTSATASLYTSTHASQAANGSRRYRPTASTSMVVK